MSSDNVPEQINYETVQTGLDPKDIASFSTESAVASEDASIYAYQSYSGEFPPLEYLEFFENTNNGSTKVILDSYVKEQEYRHTKELKQLELDNKREDNRHKEEVESMRWGFLLVIIFLAICSYGLYTGTKEGIISAIGTAIVSIVAIFLYKRKKKD